MTWKLDNIDFKDYGVGIRKASGVLDLPKLVDKGHDWLELDSVDFWQDAADLRYDDHEIVLSCWIKAATYTAFKTAVTDFYTALQGEGLRTLDTPFGTTLDCYVEKEIEMSRKTPYLSQYQLGLFTLRLTVPGDPAYNLISIKRWENPEVTYPCVLKTSDLKITKNLQGDIYLSCTCESNTKLDLNEGDWIDYEYIDGNTDRFMLDTKPSFKKKSTNCYAYDLTFDFYATAMLKRSYFLNDLQEGNFSYYGNMSDILDQILWNHARRGYTQFSKGECADTENDLHEFDAETCLDVLQRMCEEYELEYEFQKSDPDWWDYTINIKEKVSNTKSVSFEYGKGKGLYTIDRDEKDDDEFCTKLYAFGAEDNLPTGYRNGLQRLSFDNNPLSANDDDPVEAVQYFDEIYPRRTGTVSSYEQILEDDLTAAQKEVYPNGIYRLVDTSLDFDINEYLLDSYTAQVVMKTGDLAGYTFDITKYDHATKTITLIPFEDSGTIVPNEDLKISAGDEYTLVNIDMPDSYVEAAEAELEAAAQEYLNEHSVPSYEYTVTVDPAYCAENAITFEVGDEISISDEDYDVNGTFRISKLVFNDYTKKWELTLSDYAKAPRLKSLEAKVSTLERASTSTGFSTVENMRDSQKTVGYLSRRLLSPIDNQFNADDVVRKNSIDPGMLALDVDPNFYFEDALVELNYVGNEDAVHVSAGVVKITNYNTLTRYYIQKMKDLGETYDPTRSWIVPETTINLPTKDAYALYLKLDLTADSTDCTIEASNVHIEGKALIHDNYLYKRFFLISKGEEETD